MGEVDYSAAGSVESVTGYASVYVADDAMAGHGGPWPASSADYDAFCLISGPEQPDADDQWIQFHFDRPGAQFGPPIVEVGHTSFAGRQAPGLGRAAALLHAPLLARWWGADATVPALPGGRYFFTGAMERLMAQLPQSGRLCVADALRRETRVRELLFETLDAWRAGKLIAVAGEGMADAAERERLAHARRFIEANYGEKLTIDRLARLCGIGRGRLMRGFRELYGCTVSDHLAEQRLQHAAGELRATRLPVARIAYGSGYLSNAAFTRAFARRYGLTPSAYRANAVPC